MNSKIESLMLLQDPAARISGDMTSLSVVFCLGITHLDPAPR